jgi:hypothetical protein
MLQFDGEYEYESNWIRENLKRRSMLVGIEMEFPSF